MGAGLGAARFRLDAGPGLPSPFAAAALSASSLSADSLASLRPRNLAVLAAVLAFSFLRVSLARVSLCSALRKYFCAFFSALFCGCDGLAITAPLVWGHAGSSRDRRQPTMWEATYVYTLRPVS